MFKVIISAIRANENESLPRTYEFIRELAEFETEEEAVGYAESAVYDFPTLVAGYTTAYRADYVAVDIVCTDERRVMGSFEMDDLEFVTEWFGDDAHDYEDYDFIPY